jgi:hypothetical protein
MTAEEDAKNEDKKKGSVRRVMWITRLGVRHGLNFTGVNTEIRTSSGVVLWNRVVSHGGCYAWCAQSHRREAIAKLTT